MTEEEAAKIQNSINVLQEILDEHYDSINRIRPQQKGLKTKIAEYRVDWNLAGGILNHIEVINSGSRDISLNIYNMHTALHMIDPEIIMDAYGTCINVTYVGSGNTESLYIGYPCNDFQQIIIEVNDARDNEILESILVQ